MRNVLLVTLAGDRRMHLGRLATAFGMSSEGLRLLRQVHEAEGIEAVWQRCPKGRAPKVTAALQRRLERLFAQGLSASEAHRRVQRRYGVSLTTVYRVHAVWRAGQDAAGSATETPAAESADEPRQQVLELPAVQGGAKRVVVRASGQEASATWGTPEESEGAEDTVEERGLEGGKSIQHLGTWLMMAMVARLGLHRRAEATREGRVAGPTLRMALDAVIAALSIGQGCVEGVRRLATPTAGKLLRAEHAPSATWTRRVLHAFAEPLAATKLHLAMAFAYVQTARSSEAEPVVLYVDNHLRPYAGKQVVRKGWRMQDKRVRPGTTDYYVHDEDGRPVMRVDVAGHESLTSWLSPIARTLRDALGPEQRILLAFDRAGAFPEQMAALREDNFEFVTYERRPFALLSPSEFDREVVLGQERLGLCESSKRNLRGGRGRVRRVCLRTPEQTQVNLLAVGKESAERLAEVMHGRWSQENGLKHGNERWHINQLDGRKVEPWPKDTVIPNPARRRLDRALRIARSDEGRLRRELAQLGDNDAKRPKLEQALEASMRLQRDLEAQRPSTPKRAQLADTELADTLVRHPGQYKTVLDTVRIACANAESDLAAELATHLSRPAEAKKTLANLLCAPGHARVGSRTISVHLHPAGTKVELKAFSALLAEANRWNLTLPGDQAARPLRFRLQLS
jgi:hypothetical protein